MPQTVDLRQSDALIGRIDASSMPTVSAEDLRAGRWDTVSATVRASAVQHGFLSVALETPQLQAQRAIVADMRRFFALDESIKHRVRDPGEHYGWTPSKSEPAYQPGTVSNVESYDLEKPLINDDDDPYWPSLPGFRDNARRCWHAYLDLADALLEAIARSWGLAPDFLRSRCRSRALNTMRLLHYPAEPNEVGRHEVGIAAHTDFECITLLHQTRPGLEVKRPGDGWREAPAGDDRLIVLFDDMLERWTNGRLPATGHRVRRTAASRHSIVLFIAVDPGIVVEPLPAFVEADHPARYSPTEQRRHIADEMQRARALLAQSA